MNKILNMNNVKSAIIMIYFIIMLIHNLYDNIILEYVWYTVILLIFFISFINTKMLFNRKILIFISLYCISSFFNIFLTGNNSIDNVFFTFIYIGIFLLLSERDLSEKLIYVAIAINCILVYITFSQKGLGVPILKELSNNYISVFLLLPTVVYYIRTEWKNKTISLIPAAMVWIGCLLATGRGGIIASSFLFIGLFICSSCNLQKKNGLNKLKIFRRSFWVLLVLIAVVFIGIIESQFLVEYIFQRFNRLGLYGTGRMGIWSEYISKAVVDIKSLIIGVDYDSLVQMIRYKDNLHNSFLNVHANNGIVMFLYVVLFTVGILFYLYKNKKWISLICAISFYIRALTDRIFWGGMVGTPILFFLMWFPFIIKNRCKGVAYEEK